MCVLWKPVSVLTKIASKVNFCGVFLFFSGIFSGFLLCPWLESRTVHDLSAPVNP